MPTYANGNDYGFHVASFDWAYRQTCDARYRDALSALADEIASPNGRAAYRSPILTARAMALPFDRSGAREGVSRVGDQGVKLWRCASPMNERRSEVPAFAELFMQRWVRVRAEDHSFTGTVRAFETLHSGRHCPGAHSSRSVRAACRIEGVVGRLSAGGRAVRRRARAGDPASRRARCRHQRPYQMVFPHDGIADFGSSTELFGLFLWATTLNPRSLHGRFPSQCRSQGAGAEVR